MRTPGTLEVTRGLPASGKSTYAMGRVHDAEPGRVVRLNRDDIRRMLYGPDYREPIYACEEVVSAVQQAPIVELLRSGVDVIVDDTNLRARNVRNLAQLAVKAGAEWRCVDQFLEVPLEECLRRDAARVNSVGESVIRRMHDRYLSGGRTLPVPVLAEDVTGKPYVPVPNTPLAVMVDIDGTVALHEPHRGPYDTHLYHLDRPNENVVDVVRIEADGTQILFCSGRSEEFREVTERWIADNVLPCGWKLFMRPAGDTRNDAIVKLELFDKHIRNSYTVLRVYDDRDRVVEAWRSIGLTVLQVAPGAF